MQILRCSIERLLGKLMKKAEAVADAHGASPADVSRHSEAIAPGSHSADTARSIPGWLSSAVPFRHRNLQKRWRQDV